jgi:imidazolonepropionase
MRAHKLPVAIATDCNPGTSPLLSLPLAMNMACTLFRMTPEEAFLGVTKHAAQALGIDKERGTIEIGKKADLAVWGLNHPAALAYMIGHAPLLQLVKEGSCVVTKGLVVA